MTVKLTNSAAVGGAGDQKVVEIEVLVKDLRVELRLAVEALAELFPACCGVGEVHRVS